VLQVGRVVPQGGTARGFISAIGWTAPDKLGDKVAGLLESGSPLP